MIYWDHNATSPLRLKVKERILEALELYEGNPNSSHTLGQTARSAIEKARRTLADQWTALPSEIVFTASATESNLCAIWSLWIQGQARGRKRIAISPLEHHSVSENLRFLKEQWGAEVFELPFESSGVINLEEAEKFLRQNGPWAFCSSIAAHNETGILQPWRELGEICKSLQIPYHTDLVQYVGRLPFKLKSEPVDLATLSFHKVGGPRGVSCLYIKEGMKFEPLIRGGGQERKRRAGTENILAILGAEALVEELPYLQSQFQGPIRAMRDRFEEGLRGLSIKHRIVGAEVERLPNTSYIVFPSVRSDRLLMSLDFKGLCVSSGSACSSGLVTPSESLLKLGYSEADALSGIRFSLGADQAAEEVDEVLAFLRESVLKLAA